MVTGTGITDVIKSFSDLQTRFGLYQTNQDDFFPEWTEDLRALNEQEQAGIERIKRRHDYHRVDHLLLEGTVNLIVVGDTSVN
jgi:hypothetical protein